MDTSRFCTDCEQEIPKNSMPGLCPSCLLKLADSTMVVEDYEMGACPDDVFLKEGMDFGDHELIEKIGEGGMGLVYKARQKDLNRVVALKMIRTGWLAGKQEIRRFQQEARAAASLQHPNLVSIHEVGSQEGHPYFTMDYIEGRSLSESFRGSPPDFIAAANILKTLAEAIHYAHSRGILHRDIKPSNILIDHQNQPRLTDFGLAKFIELNEAFTMTGEILGTPSYMSPEQATGNSKDIGPACDVYSLGAVLYEAVTGQPPFRSDTAVETVRQVAETDPITPQRLNPKVPRDLQTICLNCLSKKPGERYETALDLAEDLGRFLERKPVQAKPPGQARKLFLWAQRKPGMAVTSALTALVSVLSGVAAIWFRFELLDHNAYSAGLASRVIEKEIQNLQQPLISAALEIENRDLIRSGDMDLISGFLRIRLAKMNSNDLDWMDQTDTFHSLSLFNSEGYLLGRWPKAESPDGTNIDYFGDRNHFEGATNNAVNHTSPKPHVSHAFQSRTDPNPDKLDKFGISIGVRSETKTNINGVLMATIATTPTRKLGSLEHHAALITRADQSDEPPYEYLMIAHPKFNAFDKAVPVHDTNWIGSASTRKGFYIDPASPNSGLWLAGKARVRDTPFIVVVQTRDHVTNALITAILILIALVIGFSFYRRFRQKSSSDFG